MLALLVALAVVAPFAEGLVVGLIVEAGVVRTTHGLDMVHDIHGLGSLLSEAAAVGGSWSSGRAHTTERISAPELLDISTPSSPIAPLGAGPPAGVVQALLLAAEDGVIPEAGAEGGRHALSALLECR
jgi:hypothetical protein